jgi:hypothetical protein
VAPDDSEQRGEDAAPDLLWGSRGYAHPPLGTAATGSRDGEQLESPERDRWAELWREPPLQNGHVGGAPASAPVTAGSAVAAVGAPAPQVWASDGSRRRRRRSRRPPAGPRTGWVVHRIRVWSVCKLAFCVLAFLYAVALGAAALLWWIATSAGLVHNLEKFLRDIGFTDFRFHGGELMQGVAIVGAIAVVVFTVFSALAASVVNVISELTGGLRLVITEEGPRSPRESRLRRRRSDPVFDDRR